MVSAPGDEGGVPPAAVLLRDFVNTLEPQVDEESWGSPDDLQDWLVGRGLLAASPRLTASDLAAAVTIREGLRALLLGHAGHTPDDDAIRALNRVLATIPVRLDFDETGYRLRGAGETPFGQATAALADAVRRCSEDGTWWRLKVCARDTCRWAFYDASRNQVRRWCSMAGCGNHVKMQRAYAVRKARAEEGEHTGPDR